MGGNGKTTVHGVANSRLLDGNRISKPSRPAGLQPLQRLRDRNTLARSKRCERSADAPFVMETQGEYEMPVNSLLPRPSGLRPSGLRCLAAAAVMLLTAALPAKAAEPIKIGFGMSLTGPLAANGKMSLVAMQVWESDINAQGGLLGRPVKLVYYDDQSKPAEVPAIYAKLLDIDKVDLIVSRLRLDPDRRGDADRDPAQEAVRQPVRHRRQQRLHLQQIFRDDPERADAEAGVHPRLLQGGGGAEPASRRPSRSLMSTPSSGRTRAKARATTPRRPASTSSTTRAIRRARPISRRSCARSRRAIRTCW